jgi:hypothetical protein
MIYMLFATQTPPPGHLERVVFIHPGNAQQVQQYAQQLMGKEPKVPYQLASLARSQPGIYCRQVRPMALPAGASQGIADGQQLGAPDMPTDLRPARPTDELQHQVAPSPLGPGYGQIPSSLAGEF